VRRVGNVGLGRLVVVLFLRVRSHCCTSTRRYGGGQGRGGRKVCEVKWCVFLGKERIRLDGDKGSASVYYSGQVQVHMVGSDLSKCEILPPGSNSAMKKPRGRSRSRERESSKPPTVIVLFGVFEAPGMCDSGMLPHSMKYAQA
jgi:hypothetical protein